MTSSSIHTTTLGPDFQPLGHALLLATVNDLDELPHALGPVIANAAKATKERLVIVLFSRLFNTGKRARSRSPAAQRSVSRGRTDSLDTVLSRAGMWDDVQRLLTYVYVQATKVAQDMDKVLLDVDVLLRGFDEDLPSELAEGMDVVFRVEGDSLPVPLPESIGLLHTAWGIPGDKSGTNTPSPPPSSPIAQQRGPSTFPVVAVGGTFDHLHAGHKILLSMTAWIAEKKIIVGVTDDALLTKKTNKDVMEDLTVRTRRVHDFVARFKPGLTYDVVSINDVYGPTGWDPDIQALVVSRETVSGADSIAKHRAAKNLPLLRTFVIDVISHNDASLDAQDIEMLKATKMSSTFIREWIVKQKKAGLL